MSILLSIVAGVAMKEEINSQGGGSQEINPLEELEKLFYVQKERLDRLLNPPKSITGATTPSPLEVSRAMEEFKDTLLALQQAQITSKRELEKERMRNLPFTERVRFLLDAIRDSEEEN